MVGILTKKWDKWYVVYNVLDEDLNINNAQVLPVHPDDDWLDTCDGNEGAEYQFNITKITKEDASGKSWSEHVAKLLGKSSVENELWISIYNDAVDSGINTMEEFTKYLKENYKPPVKLN